MNLIQVYGLPRSGTNFMEWTLINNFKNVEYKNIYVKNNVENFYMYGKKDALKHDYPSLQRSKYAIVIFKDFDKWVESMIKYNKKRFAKFSVYERYLKKANNLNQDYVLVLNHKYVLSNYFSVLDRIENKFNITQIKNPNKPKYRLNREGANVKQTSKLYNE